MADLNCAWLRTFLAIVNTASFTRASRELHLSQSAVSRRVKELESTLGTPLFERLTGQVHLTPAGRMLVGQAEKILLHADEASRVLQEIETGAAGELRIGATVTAANYLFPGLLAVFRRRYPRVRLVLRPASSEKLLAMVRRNELDIAAVSSALPAEGMKVRGYIKDELVIATPPEHPLANRRGLKPAAISGQDFILRDPSSSSRRYFEEWAHSAGISIRVLMDVW
jgi:DNA-binding transcriptional LysR family regulator